MQINTPLLKDGEEVFHARKEKADSSLRSE
jgi:hypothetical protein